MSEVLYERPGIQLSRHVGPADEGPDRRRWQLTVEGAYIVLQRPELRELAAAFALADSQAGSAPEPMQTYPSEGRLP